MQIEKYLEKYQPIIYKTFTNALQKQQLSHAYLLVGNPGTPLLDVATFLAKSIICDDPSPLACNSCITCLRIESNNYPDFLIFDGSKEGIKKSDVLMIENKFESHSFERKGVMIYILHLVENMTKEAVNSILKFLEEPSTPVYAFLTTNNINSILPTIVSRCQTLQLNLIDRNEVIEGAIKLGVPQDDAELLSYFYNSDELIFDLLRDYEKGQDKEENEKLNKIKIEKESYKKSKESIIGLLEALNSDDKEEAIFYAENKIIPQIKSKEHIRYFLDMLAQIFQDLINIQNNKPIYLKIFATTLNELSGKIPHISDTLTNILKQRGLINLNINISLQIDSLIINMVKE